MSNKQLDLISITIIGFDFNNALAFDKKLNDILKLEELEEFNFKKVEFKVKHNQPISPEMIKNFTSIIPVSIYEDKERKISISYDIPQNKLDIILKDSVTNIKDIAKIALNILKEQSDRLTALGYNFVMIYNIAESQSIQLINNTNSAIENILKEAKAINIDKTDVRFRFYENDYAKTYIVEKQDENENTYCINANYHYDEFKSLRSTSKIRDYIIERIKSDFESSFSEFELISDRIAEE